MKYCKHQIWVKDANKYLVPRALEEYIIKVTDVTKSEVSYIRDEQRYTDTIETFHTRITRFHYKLDVLATFRKMIKKERL